MAASDSGRPDGGATNQEGDGWLSPLGGQSDWYWGLPGDQALTQEGELPTHPALPSHTVRAPAQPWPSSGEGPDFMKSPRLRPSPSLLERGELSDLWQSNTKKNIPREVLKINVNFIIIINLSHLHIMNTMIKFILSFIISGYSRSCFWIRYKNRELNR